MRYPKSVSRRIGGLLNVLTIFPALITSLVILMPSTRVLANDSLAALGVGGLELTRSEHIRMLEEILEISTKDVKVKYRFLNQSDKDIHTTVAFPIPPNDCSSPMEHPALYDRSLEKSFKVLVNSRSVSTKTDRKAIIDGHDITAQLRAIGLSDHQIFDYCDSEGKLIKTLTTDQKAAVEKLRREQWQVVPWNVAVILFWQQTFPAGREVVVEHSYEPATGGGFAVLHRPESPEDLKKYMDKFWDSFTGDPDHEREACLDDTTRRAIQKRVEKAISEGVELVRLEQVAYILGTGRNWKGPIAEFTLRIKKQKASDFVSLCFPGKPEKISPTVYEFHQTDFVPSDRLVVYFYTTD